MVAAARSRWLLALLGVAALTAGVGGVAGPSGTTRGTVASPLAALDTSDSSLHGLHHLGTGPTASLAPSPSPALAHATALATAGPGATPTARASRVAAPRPAPTGTVPPGAGGPDLGMFEDLEFLTGSSLATRLDEYQALGVRVARFQLIWSNVQYAGPGSYDWTYIDAVVAGLVARGIEPLPVIDTSPAWARPPGCTAQVCAPAGAAAYGTFAGAAAARYAPRGVHAWEIWNEPNNPIFWQPAPDPALYTAMLKSADSAIHQADPGATVVSGGLAPAATGGGWIAPVEFLSDMYADGSQGSFDAVGWHPYDYPDVPGSTSNNAWNQMSGTAESARSLMQAHGDGAKRIWATEFGAPTCTADPSCVSEGQQAQDLALAYSLWSSYSWAGPLIVYSYQDLGTNEANREDHFGLVRADGSQKPAYATYLSLATRS